MGRGSAGLTSVVGGVVGVAAGAPWPFADTVGGVDGASGAFRFGGVRGGVEDMALGQLVAVVRGTLFRVSTSSFPSRTQRVLRCPQIN